MPIDISEAALAAKLAALQPHLNERQWRLLLGAEALAIGRGGIMLITRLSGAYQRTVSAGAREIRSGFRVGGQPRRRGGGATRTEQVQPGISEALADLVARHPGWSAASLANALSVRGFHVGKLTVARMLRDAR